MIKRLVVLTLVFGLFGCAKNRDVERVRDGDKQNILSKNDFYAANKRGERGRWLTKLTVVNTSDSPAGTLFLGYQSDVQAGYFDFTETHLQFRSIKGKLGGVENENLKNSVIMNWGVDHIDYALDERDGQTTNQEIEDNFRTWDQRKYFRIKWAEQKTISNTTSIFPISSFAFFDCWQPVNVRRVDNSMKIEPDHIGFNVEVVYQRNVACASANQWNAGDFNFTATFKYSFRKLEETDYQKKAYAYEQDPARYKYGHFQTVGQSIDEKNGRPYNVFMENRWAEKTQYFYFVKGFPEKYKWIWDHNNPHSVFGQTNALLAHHKSKLRFEIYDYNHNHESSAVPGPEREFGDLRYSFINFIEQIEAGGTPLGYGPSDTNPFTGEIIAANSMVWTGMMGFYIDLMDSVGKSVQDPKGNPKQSSLFRQLKAALDTQDLSIYNTEWDQTKGVGKLFKHIAQKSRYGLPFWNSYTSDENGHAVVGTQYDYYKTGEVSFKDPLKLASGITEIIPQAETKIPFDFETQKAPDGKYRKRVINPFSPINTDWLEALGHRNDAVLSADFASFVKILNNLNLAQNKKYEGPAKSISDMLADHSRHLKANIEANRQGHCILDFEEFAGGAAGFLQATKLDFSNPKVRDDFLNTVLYRVSIHEFGHNLNLRHNFYGSIDQENFGFNSDKASIAKFPGSNTDQVLEVVNGEIVKSTDPILGNKRVQVSSSVMDYLRLEDEINTPWAWEDYDVAAILDSYAPKGFDDQGELYLFCTDEHTATSALCNRHDFGTTPSQILMSQIRSYDERYEMRNKRFGRATWNTAGYASSIISTMVSMKEFIPLWRSAFAEDLVNEELEKLGVTNPNDQKAYLEEINREFRKVMKLSMGFYQAVIQQSRGDRDFRSKYEETTGALTQMGIITDKIFAMMMLAGDDPIYFNPNRIMLHNSYLTYSNDSGDLAEFTDQIWRNIVTDRNIAMEPWFINFARFQYAKNAKNYNNRSAADLIEAMRLVKVADSAKLLEVYGIEATDVAEPVQRLELPKASGTFGKGEDVVVVHIDGVYYIASVTQGHIAFSLTQDTLNKLESGDSDDQQLDQFFMDVREFHWLYNIAQDGVLQ